MGVDISWHDPAQTVIYWKFTDRWSWSEFDRAWSTCGEWIAAAHEPVDFILDFQESTLMPPDIMSRFRQPAYERLQNFQGQNMNVVVFDDFFLRILAITFMKVFVPRMIYAFATNSEDAAKLIDDFRRQDRVG